MLPATLFSVILAATTFAPLSSFALPTPYTYDDNELVVREPLSHTKKVAIAGAIIGGLAAVGAEKAYKKYKQSNPGQDDASPDSTNVMERRWFNEDGEVFIRDFEDLEELDARDPGVIKTMLALGATYWGGKTLINHFSNSEKSEDS